MRAESQQPPQPPPTPDWSLAGTVVKFAGTSLLLVAPLGVHIAICVPLTRMPANRHHNSTAQWHRYRLPRNVIGSRPVLTAYSRGCTKTIFPRWFSPINILGGLVKLSTFTRRISVFTLGSR